MGSVRRFWCGLALALGASACAPASGASPSAAPALEPASDDASAASVRAEWVGTWNAQFGGTQEFARATFDADGAFRGEVQFGPDEHCCFMGTYTAGATEIRFELDANSCPTGVFSDYTSVLRSSNDAIVIADPRYEDHIVEEDDGRLSGPVWTLERSEGGAEVPACVVDSAANPESEAAPSDSVNADAG